MAEEVVAVVDSTAVDPVLSVEADRVTEVVTDSLAETVVDPVVASRLVLSVEAVDRAEDVVAVADSVAEAVLLSVEAVDTVSEETVVATLRDEEDRGGKHGEASTSRARAKSERTNISVLMTKNKR